MTTSLAALVAIGIAAGDQIPCTPELFRVVRNTNANVVVYEARVAASGELDPEEPVHASWRMLAEDGRREELNLVESAMAYGVDAARDGTGEGYAVTLRARPELVIHVTVEQGCPVARARIGGRDVRLARVEVEASGGLFPRVAHVDLVGSERVGGAVVRERIVAVE